MAKGLGDLLQRFRPTRPDTADSDRIKGWVRTMLALSDETIVTVSEIACTDPACPGLETVILVMRPGEKAMAYKSFGSVVVQTRPLIEKAVAG
jgi:hypothetical protein